MQQANIIHIMITNKYEPQQKHRLGMVSKKLLGGLNRFYGIPTSPSASIMGHKLLGSLPVLSAHSFASNRQLLFLNQWKRENGRRNVFMTKSPRKNVPDVGIELGAACMPSELASDRATAPGLSLCNSYFQEFNICLYNNYR